VVLRVDRLEVSQVHSLAEDLLVGGSIEVRIKEDDHHLSALKILSERSSHQHFPSCCLCSMRCDQQCLIHLVVFALLLYPDTIKQPPSVFRVSVVKTICHLQYAIHTSEIFHHHGCHPRTHHCGRESRPSTYHELDHDTVPTPTRHRGRSCPKSNLKRPRADLQELRNNNEQVGYTRRRMGIYLIRRIGQEL